MIERRRSERYPIILPALCWSRNRRDFYAVTQDISVDGIRMRSATEPLLGEELNVSIPQIGEVEALVLRAGGQSFVVQVLSRTRPVGEVARKLVLLSQQQDGTADGIRAGAQSTFSYEAWRGADTAAVHPA